MRHRTALLVMLLLVAGATVAAPPAHAAASVSLSFFYDSLAPYGEWMVSADYGYVWRPAGVSVGWRPYSDGQWVYTDYGWTMLSDQPWGWAAYHYGRWAFDARFGWFWVPGTEWAPAWVSFYQGDGWIGWAPLPPRVAVGVNVTLDPRTYCFVDERHFADRSVGRYIVPSVRNATLVRRSVNVTRFSRSGDRWVNRSVPVERIERVTARAIAPRRISDVVESRSVPRPEVHADRVTLYRPQIDARQTHPPAHILQMQPAQRGASGRETSGKHADNGRKKGPPPPRH